METLAGMSADECDLDSSHSDSVQHHKHMVAVDAVAGIFGCLMDASGPQSLKEIAARAGMSPSSAHRYLRALIAKDFIQQSHRSGKYDLGIGALRLGVTALERIDLLTRTNENLEELVQTTGYTAHTTVWGSHGPVIVYVERSPAALDFSAVVGARRPVWASAAGNCFLAFMPRDVVRPALEHELAQIIPAPSEAEIAARIADIRRKGFAYSKGTFTGIVTGIAAPVINAQNQACAAVTILKPHARDGEDEAPVMRRLTEFCARMSA
jgi:DNA-binding IclR family transcriptional regulator